MFINSYIATLILAFCTASSAFSNSNDGSLYIRDTGLHPRDFDIYHQVFSRDALEDSRLMQRGEDYKLFNRDSSGVSDLDQLDTRDFDDDSADSQYTLVRRGGGKGGQGQKGGGGGGAAAAGGGKPPAAAAAKSNAPKAEGPKQAKADTGPKAPKGEGGKAAKGEGGGKSAKVDGAGGNGPKIDGKGGNPKGAPGKENTTGKSRAAGEMRNEKREGGSRSWPSRSDVGSRLRSTRGYNTVKNGYGNLRSNAARYGLGSPGKSSALAGFRSRLDNARYGAGGLQNSRSFAAAEARNSRSQGIQGSQSMGDQGPATKKAKMSAPPGLGGGYAAAAGTGAGSGYPGPGGGNMGGGGGDDE